MHILGTSRIIAGSGGIVKGKAKIHEWMEEISSNGDKIGEKFENTFGRD